MNVLFRALPIRDEHFRWCRVERTLGHHDCQRCQGQLYLLAIVAAIAVAALEFFGSHYTGSRSLWSDAWHVVSDGLGYLIGFGYAISIVYRFWNPHVREHFKAVGEFFLGSLLVISAVGIFTDSMVRLWVGQMPVITEGATFLAIAVLGLAFNVVFLSLFWAFGVGHEHAHGEHCHNRSENQILQGNFWHTVGDTLSSVLVLFTAGIASFTSSPSVRYLDVLGAAAIAVLLFWQGFRILVKSWQKH